MTVTKRVRNVRIIWVMGRLRYEHYMSISASTSFQLEGCSYYNLNDHRKEGFHTRTVLLDDHERCPDQTAELSLEHPANICPLFKAIIIVGLIC